MTEKEDIERATAEGFLLLYNEHFRESFCVVEHADAPDIRCANNAGELLGLEITLTEDRPRDIASLLGRSEHRSLYALRQSRQPGPNRGRFPPFSSLSDNVASTMASRIAAKFNKYYGRRVALVVRDSSPLDWAWDLELDRIRASLDLSKSPFDMGIWILSYRKDKLYRVV